MRFLLQEDAPSELLHSFRKINIRQREETHMVIRGRAPLRVSFGGGGTDVAPFCEEQGGARIGSHINQYAY